MSIPVQYLIISLVCTDKNDDFSYSAKLNGFYSLPSDMQRRILNNSVLGKWVNQLNDTVTGMMLINYVQHRYSSLLKLLLVLKPNIINLPLNDDDDEATVLVWAAHYGCQDILQQLLDQSRTPLANVNARAQGSNNTALHEVITASEKFGSNDIFLQVVKTLLGTPGINLGFENSQDYTPIQLAIEKKLWKVVALLLPHYPAQQIADLKGDDLKALFFSAVKGGDTFTVQTLLKAKPALIKKLSPDSYHCSALIWAASDGNLEMVQLLLDMGAEKMVNQQDALGNTGAA